ncbi:ADP-dependent NAD(P)H-hydrate dehydratase [Microbacterium gorillae]|uniref:ADP-dependent NAD(P)H-hydrate dehydratase n=1 Tax=Microbacterium gorillae TaxID=1231063 RepID=UPI00058F8477|nr:ADP/ATP-dependent (S)-NAD(P)H-hydrate dehydratase [Microbacterium gorillae]
MVESWTLRDCWEVIPRPGKSDDKYSRGVVGLRTGSEMYPGAAVLGVQGAWGAGAGLVRWVGDPDVGRLVLQRRPETVIGAGRADAWVVGSGTDPEQRTEAETAAVRELLAGDVPVVLDAGCLDLAEPDHTAPLVITPHEGEFLRLAERLNLPMGENRTENVLRVAQHLNAVVLRKGSTTRVVEPGGSGVVVTSGTPWLATAGTGDVLAGAIGTVIAQARAADLWRAVATAAWLHGRAGRLASGDSLPGPNGDPMVGRPITALAVADALPYAVADVLAEIS